MTDEKETEKPKLSAEQIIEFKKKMVEGYTKEIEFLEVQVKYEELHARILEAKARSARAEVVLAQIYAPGPSEEEEKKQEAKADTPLTGERKLKVTPT